jgi:hypothetical protein
MNSLEVYLTRSKWHHLTDTVADYSLDQIHMVRVMLLTLVHLTETDKSC